ncbi:hypothetical protein BLOT_004332 [Blomia tropicalis]|nr:hypothetical protein BLOT_004332 [Blomia tropicalis]
MNQQLSVEEFENACKLYDLKVLPWSAFIGSNSVGNATNVFRTISELFELCAIKYRNQNLVPKYTFTEEPNLKLFTCTAIVDGNHAKASASTKNLAKTNASFKLLCLLKNIKIENESDNCKTVQSVPISEKNYVSQLYEYCTKTKRISPQISFSSSDLKFTCTLSVDECVGIGTCTTKKGGKEAASKDLLDKLKIKDSLSNTFYK